MAARPTSKSKPKRPKKNALTPARIIELLDGEYGTLPWRPAGDPIAELVLTLLSQNTSDSNSGRAFIRLLNEFPDYESLLDADVKKIEKAIQPGGLAPTKAPRMQAMLREVWSRRGDFDLTFLQELPLEEPRAWLVGLPGLVRKAARGADLVGPGRRPPAYDRPGPALAPQHPPPPRSRHLPRRPGGWPRRPA